MYKSLVRSIEMSCSECGSRIYRIKSQDNNPKPFKCFDCKKKRIADNWRRKKQFIHKTIHIPAIDNNQKVV